MREIHFNRPMFLEQVEPKGRLTLDPKCHACWYYFMLAYSNFLKVGDGPSSQIIEVDEGLETPLWMDLCYHQIAKTVALIYGLDSPDDFLPYFPLVEAEAKRLNPEEGQAFEIPIQIVAPFGIGVTQQ